jgi:hypothetical protein
MRKPEWWNVQLHSAATTQFHSRGLATISLVTRELILLANSRGRPFGTVLGETGLAGQGKAAVPDAPHEFASSIKKAGDSVRRLLKSKKS